MVLLIELSILATKELMIQETEFTICEGDGWVVIIIPSS